MAEEMGILLQSARQTQREARVCTHKSAFDIAYTELEPNLLQILTQEGTAYLISSFF